MSNNPHTCNTEEEGKTHPQQSAACLKACHWPLFVFVWEGAGLVFRAECYSDMGDCIAEAPPQILKGGCARG